MGFLGFLGGPLGWVMDLIYQVVQSYGWAIILFTVLTRVVMLPFSIKQQKSTARMQAYQPMINEINKKWANDKQKQQEEMMRLQEEYGFSPTAGCLPMLLTMLVLFGVIDVVYKPLQHILRIPADLIEQARQAMDIANNYMTQNVMIANLQADPNAAGSIFSAEQIDKITSFNFHFLGIDLSQMPRFEFTPEALPLLIFPVLSHQDERPGDDRRHEMDALDHEPAVRDLQLPGARGLLALLHHLQRADDPADAVPQAGV